MIANGNLPLVGGDNNDSKDAEIGGQDERELAQAVDEAIRRAVKYLTNRLKISFRNIVQEYMDIFRICLGADPPVDVRPIEIKFEGTEQPVKYRQCTYSAQKLDFMKKNVLNA